MLLQNDELVLTQSIQGGVVSGHTFDQLTHYSFQSDQSLQPNEHVTAYRKGQLIWGTPPPYTLPAGMLLCGVLTSAAARSRPARVWRSSRRSDPRVHFTGNTSHSTAMPYPIPDPLELALLQSAFDLDVAHATLTVPNGKYWVYPYLVSEDGGNQSDLFIQSQSVITFLAGMSGGGPTWARLGPFPVTVSTGKLDFSSPNGPLRLAGVELYQAGQ